jgi:hypothetical protein
MTPEELEKMWTAHQSRAFQLGLMVGLFLSLIILAVQL